MSKDWTQRPSTLLAIEDPYEAWCVDEAVYVFGNHVEHAMDTAESGVKQANAKGAARLRVLTNILEGGVSRQGDATGDTKERPAVRGQFRDPASVFKK